MSSRSLRLLSGALMLSTAFALPAAVPASANHATLFGLEVFEPEPGEVPAPLCGDTSRGVQPPASADLPSGTVPVAVLQGSVRRPRVVNRCRFRVSTGAERFTVYRSAETRVDNRPLLRSGVRVVAARDEQTGVLVAERVVGRSTARNEAERAFLTTVAVTTRGPQWSVTEVGGTGRTFTFDMTVAEFDPPELALTGSPVAIEFDTVAPPPD
jgi:hypothetical protein